MDISNLSVQDLLTGVADAARPARTPAEMWLQNAGIYPGTTRISATDLYREFHMWWKLESGLADTSPPGIRLWGKQMAGKFKTGRGKSGIFYYISRESVLEIPPDLLRGGPGNPGGSTPGGAGD